jgi:hypothetical protein
MKESKQFLNDPDESIEGYKIIEKYVTVAGTKFRMKDVVPFASKGNIWIELEAEPDNKFDKNAIKVIGCTKGGIFSKKRYFIGYIAKEISEVLVNRGLIEHTLPRLRRIFVSDEEDTATIIIQILIKDEYQDKYSSKYDSHRGY